MKAPALRIAGRHVGPRAGPVAISLAAHAALLGWVAIAPLQDRAPRDRPYSVYRELIQPNEKKLIWYHFPNKLPRVSPPEPVKSRASIRAEVKRLGQSVIAKAPRAPRANLMVWQPLPKLKVQQNIPLPNLFALKAPPPQTQPPRPQPRPFLPPPRRVMAPAPALPDAPKLQVALDTHKILPRGDLPDPLLIKPKLKNFIPPPEAPRPAPTLTDAPALTTSTANSQLSAAIVSLQPADKLIAPLPEGSRPAQFSAGPDTGATNSIASDGTAALAVPDLLIRNTAKEAQSTLMARATLAPTSPENLVETAKGMIHTPARPRPKAMRVSSAPDPMLQGREIYIVSIQMPNVTSYTGSWIIWFAERGKTPAETGDIRPPIPLKKVDPKYYPAAMADRVEGKVQLSAVISREGRVHSVNLLKRLDERLDRSAEEALRKWEFQPALRDGQPVDVDAVVEIPFRLAPLGNQ